MEESLFTKIIGLRGEDVTTEILTYILTDDSYKHLRYLIMTLLLKIKKEEVGSYNVNTQKDYKNRRPDIIIENDNETILIENKFYAEFSGGDQIKRYLDILENDEEHKVKKLYLLTVKNRKDYLICKIKEQLNENNIEKYCKKRGISFSIILWNDILELIETNDLITKNLKKFIYENYIVSTEIGEEEMELMNSDKIPSIINKIWDAITSNRTYMDMNEYNVGRMSQSRTSYFYYIHFTWGRICVQYYHDFWLTYETPFSIQLMNEWNKIEKDLTWLLKIGFFKNENNQYLYPIKIKGKDISEELNNIVLEKVTMIRNEFSA
jgi:hypothetical protein